MNKNIFIYTFIAAALFIMPGQAQAQVPVPNEEAYVNQYVTNAEAPRRASWWNALGRQLTNRVDKPYEEISVAELQNIIFFATHHKDNVKLNDAIPSLLEVFKNHEDPQYRLMSVAALNAIGNRKAMIGLSNLVDDEPSERVSRLTRKAIDKYFEID